MNRVFYGMAIVIAVTLILIASSVNRKKTTETQTNDGAGSFNAEQLPFDSTQGKPLDQNQSGQDAAGKQPAP